MNKVKTRAHIFLLVIGLVQVAYSASHAVSTQQTSEADWKPVEQALGKAGSMQPDDVYKVSFPRSDLKVTAVGLKLKPALALDSFE